MKAVLTLKDRGSEVKLTREVPLREPPQAGLQIQAEWRTPQWPKRILVLEVERVWFDLVAEEHVIDLALVTEASDITGWVDEVLRAMRSGELPGWRPLMTEQEISRLPHQLEQFYDGWHRQTNVVGDHGQ